MSICFLSNKRCCVSFVLSVLLSICVDQMSCNYMFSTSG
jgi:hypothetical protein